jgi:hypothetical protein
VRSGARLTWDTTRHQPSRREHDSLVPVHRRQARQIWVEPELLAHPELRVVFDGAHVPLEASLGEPVSVVLAVRTPVGIVSGELRIPRERFDAPLFLRVLETSCKPS